VCRSALQTRPPAANGGGLRQGTRDAAAAAEQRGRGVAPRCHVLIPRQIMPFRRWVKPLYSENMKSKFTLDRAGRVVLPKSLRDEMRLSPGDTLDLTVKGDEVTLRPS